ncbi:response regulator [Thalassococcus sp. S3]|uniref:response regulator n=1 Tax=Thalassococcus sp. S3 TaxID=2017482 RepID=UPI0010244C6C|nr:response regulator [Thalassococcus sp. S3]QBF33972.1 phosphohydrolase [Thalassococcus sp. S3]
MSAKPAVLFVDDEERIVKLLKIMFRNTYDVYTAQSGQDALAILETREIKVIVSDQRMPNMTGIELLSQVRERWPDTVRILLTGYSDLVAIIGAVNEGEVFRFVSKPWDQNELRAIVAEAIETQQKPEEVETEICEVDTDPQFSIASKLLTIDGVHADRQEVVEMFTKDYHVHSAATIREALEIIQQEQIGVIVTNTEVEGIDVSEMLARVSEIDPAITVVALTSNPDSDMIIKLINRGRIYRFAIKPLSPNVFRLAVNTAMREHHRRLADPRLMRNRIQRKAGEDGDVSIFEDFVNSLSRFTVVN